MSFNLRGAVPVEVEVFGSLVTEMSPLNVPDGISPDNQDVEFTPGSVQSRRRLQKVLASALASGGPHGYVPTVVYGKSYVSPDGTIYNLIFDSNGILWVEKPQTTPGVVTQLASAAPGSYCKSITDFGREYIAISDGLHGTECALQYDGTNIDRVTQDGPGYAPVVTSFSIPAVATSASAAVTALPVTEADPAGGYGGTNPQINFWTAASVANIHVGDLVTITGNASPAMNVINAPVIGIYVGVGGANSVIVLQASTPAGTVFGLGGSAAIATSVTIKRAANIVTVNTVAPHQIQVGYRVHISGFPATVVGGAISTIVVNNSDMPGIATVTTTQNHGLTPGNLVTLNGIAAATIGGGIASVSRQGQVVTVTTNSAHGLSPGALVTLSGVSNGSFNTSAPVLNVISATVFTFAQVDTDATSSGGTLTLLWPIPTTSTPVPYEVLTAPTLTSFLVQFNYSNGTWAGGTVQFSWDGTFFVKTVASATTFTYEQDGPDATSNAVRNITPYGQLAPGQHKLQVLFQTRNGAITRGSPVVSFTSNGGQYISVSQIPIGPPNVVARILAFTGAGGSFFYYIPGTPTVNGQIVGTATQINDNTSTTAILDFADVTLFAALCISKSGNNLQNQVVLDGALGFGSYASRLFAYGQRNRVQNLLGMGFEGGYNSAFPNMPAGWDQSRPNGSLVAGHFGVVYQIITAADGLQYGNLSQPCYEDTYGAPILTPNTKYKLRIWCKPSTATADLTLTVTLGFSAVPFSSSAIISGAAMDINGGYVEANFSFATPAAIPSDLRLGLYAVTTATVVTLQIDDMSVIYTQTPYSDTTAYASYVNNPEGFDGVSGVIGAADDSRKIMETVTQTVSQQTGLYLITRDPTGRLHKIINNGTTEPAYWPVSQVGSNCGALSAFCTTKSQADDSTASGGEEWFAWASASGARIYDGNQPWKISQENQPIWDCINDAAALTCWAVNDPNRRVIYFGLPIDPTAFAGTFPYLAALAGGTAPNLIYPIDYRELDTAYQIAQSPPVHTSYSGRLIATDHTRKSTRWNIPANGAALMLRAPAQLELTIFSGNGQAPGAAPGFGNLYTLVRDYAFDDDYGPMRAYYTTYFFVTPEQAQALRLGGGRKMLSYFEAMINGVGYAKVTALVNDLGNPWPIIGKRALTGAPLFDLEWPGGSVTGQRIAFRIEASLT